MPGSRLAVLLVVAIVLLPAAFVVSRRGAGAESPPPAPASAPAPKPAAPAKPKLPPKEGKRANARTRPRRASKPARAVAAVKRGETVVVLFSDGRGADTTETSRSVRALRRRAPKVRVFIDSLASFEAYQPLVGNLGVSQSPSVVIVGRGAEARVVEGYVDPRTLRQQVLDARR